MAELICSGYKYSLEEYIRQQVSVNNGASTRIQAHILQDILEKLNIKCKKSATKDELLTLIFDYYKSWIKVAEILKIGVKVNYYTNAFSFIEQSDIKRLERFGIIKVIGKEQFRAYGKYLFATLYDLEQFIKMTDDDMKVLLEQFPKGKKKALLKEI